APDLPRQITTDEGKLRQVLLNLIGNALKFTESGRVLLRVEREGSVGSRDLTRAASTTSQSFITLHFTIADTGVGIAPDEIDRLFEPFSQTQSGQMAQEGTGLGLAISRRFVQLMGGDISVRSRLNNGSAFQFTIAVQSVSEPPSEFDPLPDVSQVIGLASDQPSYRLLVVEDQMESRQYLARLLIAIGFEVRQAENGQEAIALWQRWQPHLILLDMRMPVMDGYETARRIKSSAQGQTPIIIAVTGDVFAEDQAAMLSAGCDDFVGKPVQAKELLLKLAQYLGVDYSYESASADPEGLPERTRTALPERTRELGEPDRSPVLASTQADSVRRELAVMSPDWMAQLRQAAQSCSDRQVLDLIAQIPAEQAALAELLSSLAADYRFDDMLDLITAAAKP
ncbi:MAG: response regulator, partial [Microcoleus sp. SIO2G3]|nr:response regulator [Microcoleus sp. SIO2G3]